MVSSSPPVRVIMVPLTRLKSKNSPPKSESLCGFLMAGIPINVRSVLGAAKTAINHPAWFVVCLQGTEQGRQGGKSWVENPGKWERLTRHKTCGRRDYPLSQASGRETDRQATRPGDSPNRGDGGGGHAPSCEPISWSLLTSWYIIFIERVISHKNKRSDLRLESVGLLLDC